MMKLYRISQESNNDYDTYDSAIVCAVSNACAKLTHPCPYTDPEWDGIDQSGTWTDVGNVECELIGAAVEGTPKGVILASFNAG